MMSITKELKEKLLAAESVEEVTELVKADGQEITAEKAERLSDHGQGAVALSPSKNKTGQPARVVRSAAFMYN